MAISLHLNHPQAIYYSPEPAIRDNILSVMRRFDCTAGPCVYGVMWRHGDVYPGNDYPQTETEYDFFQYGSGNNGG